MLVQQIPEQISSVVLLYSRRYSTLEGTPLKVLLCTLLGPRKAKESVVLSLAGLTPLKSPSKILTSVLSTWNDI